MMSNMTDEQLAAMSSASGMSPDMAKTAMKMMKNMKKEDMAKMMEMATKMQPPPGSEGAGGAPDQAAMMKQAEEMMKDPDMMKSVTDMVRIFIYSHYSLCYCFTNVTIIFIVCFLDEEYRR